MNAFHRSALSGSVESNEKVYISLRLSIPVILSDLYFRFHSYFSHQSIKLFFTLTLFAVYFPIRCFVLFHLVLFCFVLFCQGCYGIDGKPRRDLNVVRIGCGVAGHRNGNGVNRAQSAQRNSSAAEQYQMWGTEAPDRIVDSHAIRVVTSTALYTIFYFLLLCPFDSIFHAVF